MDHRPFLDRTDAGVRLAQALARREVRAPAIVLALPRGGVPVAFEVARALGLPLDVMTVRKIGMPGQPELAIGAVAAGGVIVREPAGALLHAVDARQFTRLAADERRELERRDAIYRAGLPPLALGGRTVVLVDDGLATGATMLAAVRAARRAGAACVIAAAPVASDDGAALVAGEADEIVFVSIQAYLGSVGAWYLSFDQVGDAEVRDLLARARSGAETSPA